MIVFFRLISNFHPVIWFQKNPYSVKRASLNGFGGAFCHCPYRYGTTTQHMLLPHLDGRVILATLLQSLRDTFY